MKTLLKIGVVLVVLFIIAVAVVTSNLDKMIKACLNGRKGPVWLSIPLDVQGMEV